MTGSLNIHRNRCLHTSTATLHTGCQHPEDGTRQHLSLALPARRRQARKAGCCACTCCTHCWLGVFTACGWLCLGCGPRAFAPVCRGCCRYNALWITFCESGR